MGKLAGKINEYLIFEATEQSIDSSKEGNTSQKKYDVIAKTNGEIRPTYDAYAAFSRWARGHLKHDHYKNTISECSFQSDPRSVGTHWIADVKWGGTKDSSGKDAKLRQLNTYYSERFSTTGGKSQCKVAISQTKIDVDSSRPGPDVGLGIGWNGEDYEGVEIDTPAFSFQISDRKPFEFFSPERKNLLTEMSGHTVNGTPYLGYPTGVTRFIGIEASSGFEYQGEVAEIDGEYFEVPNYFWDVTWYFINKPNRNVTLSGVTFFKPAWNYVWPFYELTEIDNGEDESFNIKVPIAYYNAKVYYDADYSQLGIE